MKASYTNNKSFCRHSRVLAHEALTEANVQIHFNSEVVNVQNSSLGEGIESSSVLVCAHGLHIPFHEAFWCTQASPPAWLTETGLSLDADGFISVNV